MRMIPTFSQFLCILIPCSFSSFLLPSLLHPLFPFLSFCSIFFLFLSLPFFHSSLIFFSALRPFPGESCKNIQCWHSSLVLREYLATFSPTKIYVPYCQVRAAAVFALGQFVGNTTERTDLANQVDFSVCMNLTNLAYDGSPIVREARHFKCFSMI